jgi:hypothetical protein
MHEPSAVKPFSVRKTGPLSLLKYAGVASAFAGLLGAVAVLVIYPLWYLATQAKEVYSVIIACSFSPLILLFVLRARRAFRNGLFAEFLLKVTGLFAFVIFLCAQVFWTLLQIALYTLVFSPGGAPQGAPLVVLAVMTAAFGFPWAMGLVRRRRIWGKALFVFSSILLGIHYLYWTAVFVYNGYWPHTIAMAAAVAGFFFFTKITTMRREKKSPDHETTHP